MRPARIRSAKLQNTMPPTRRAVRSAPADEQSRDTTVATGSPNGSNAVVSQGDVDAMADGVRMVGYVAPDALQSNGRGFPLCAGTERVILSDDPVAMSFFPGDRRAPR